MLIETQLEIPISELELSGDDWDYIINEIIKEDPNSYSEIGNDWFETNWDCCLDVLADRIKCSNLQDKPDVVKRDLKVLYETLKEIYDK